MSLTNPTPQERAEAAAALGWQPPVLTPEGESARLLGQDVPQGPPAPVAAPFSEVANTQAQQAAPTPAPVRDPMKHPYEPLGDPEGTAAPAAKAAAPAPQPTGSPIVFGGGQAGPPQAQASGAPSYHFPQQAQAPGRPTVDYRPTEQAAADVDAALAGVGAAKKSTADEIAAARDAGTKKQIAMQAADAISEGKTRQQLAGLQQRLQEKVDAHEKETIDPDHYWADKGQGARAFATIAMTLSNAFGGFAAGFQGREFHPDKTLSEAIDRDIAVQKMNYEGHQRDIDNESNLYAQNMAAFHDDKAADAASRAEHWTMVEQQIQSIADKHGGPEAEANAKVLRAQANQEAVKAQAEAAQRFKLITQKSETDRLMGEAAQIQKQYEATLHPGHGGTGAPGRPATAAAASQPQYEARPIGKGDEAKVTSLPDGSLVWVPIAGDLAAVKSGKLTPAQAHAMHVVENPAGGYALTNKPYSGEGQFTAPAGKGAGQGGPRYKQRLAVQQLATDLDTIKTVVPGLKFGEEGARAQARYDILQKEYPQLPALDTSSSDAFDRSKGAIEEAIGDLTRRHVVEAGALEKWDKEHPGVGGAGGDDEGEQ